MNLEQIQKGQEFIIGYTTLLHVEQHLIERILEPWTNLRDIVMARNIVEECKQRVVTGFLPVRVGE